MSPQTATATGHGNLIIQVTRHGNTVLDAARPYLSLRTYTSDLWAKPSTGEKGGAGYTAMGQQETDLLSPFTRSFVLQGRERLLARLLGWLEGNGVGVQVLTGQGGRGKTRLAVELCAAAREAGWSAGFVAGDEMTRFRCQNALNEWGWGKPLLVVVDYAAAKETQIAAWLGDLLHHPASSDAAYPPFRLLLLERLGDANVYWWRRMLRAPGVARLVALDAPLVVPPIQDPTQRWALFAEAFAHSSGRAAQPQDGPLNAELDRVSAGGEPLYLCMFGLLAARIGLQAASSATGEDLALQMADSELNRIEKVWKLCGGLATSSVDLPTRLAALATLCEGWTAAEAHDAIARECAALHLGTPATEPLRAALHAALPGEAGGIAPIVPDILGGAVLVRALESLPDKGVATMLHAESLGAERVRTVVLRALRDFPRQTVVAAWLRALSRDRENPDQLKRALIRLPLGPFELAQRMASPLEKKSEDRSFALSLIDNVDGEKDDRAVGNGPQ
jgi:hypothetical protein